MYRLNNPAFCPHERDDRKLFVAFTLLKVHQDVADSMVMNHYNVCFNLLATDFFFQILAHPVFKMSVIQKAKKVAL